MFRKAGKNSLPIATLFLLVFSIFLFYLDFKREGYELTFAALDVGQGDALFIESPTGTQVLFDAGPPRRIMGELARVMPPFDRTIDAVVITNPDLDHIGGIAQVLEKYQVDYIFEPGTFNESSGYLKPKSDWYPIDYATVTFGQGIAISPIQMIRAFASIINGGFLMKPYVVQKIVSGNKITEIKPKIEKRVISSLTSETIKKMLVSTVENAEAKWSRPKGYVIGGKTGTAQVPIKGHYDASKTIASFIGFAPAVDPKFLTFVVLYEPKSSPWGSETAAPLFFEIAKDLIVYYNISPSR